jgi:hypothetical protein
MRVALTKTEFRALNALRGLPEDAHYLVMTSSPTPTGGELDGDEDAFEELVAFIGEELAEGMLSASAAKTLWRLAVKIDPSCAEWLGM